MNIKNVIYDTLEKENKQFIPQNHNPSSASFKTANGKVIGKDLLSLYYKWKGVPPSNPTSAPSILKMRLGDGVHTVIAGILAKAGIKALAEVGGKFPVTQLKRPISYRVDGIHELNGELEVLEVKSVSEDQIKGWSKTYPGIRDVGPKDEHLLQCICYLSIVPGVKRVRLLYIARDSGEMEEFILEKNGADKFVVFQGVKTIPCELNFTGIIDRWIQLEKALETNIIPQPEFRVWLNDSGNIYDKQIKSVKYRSDWEAKYSSYTDLIYQHKDNYKTATYNYILESEGEEAIKKLYAR